MLIIGAQLSYARLKGCFGIAFFFIRALLQRLYHRLQVPRVLLRSRLRALEPGIEPLALLFNLLLKLRLAISSRLRVFSFQLIQLRFSSYRLPFPLIFLGAGPRRSVYGSAERLHPRVDRGHPILLYFCNDSALARSQCGGHVRHEIGIDSGGVQISDHPRPRARCGASYHADGASQDADHRTNSGTCECLDWEITIDLLGGHGAVGVLFDHSQSVNLDASLSI